MPNLPRRYEHSMKNQDEVETIGVSAKSEWHPCLGCGISVTTAKCSECATKAVQEWVKRKHK